MMVILRFQCFQHQGDAGDQAAAAHRHDHRIEIGILLVQFEAEGALTGNNPGIVERRDERQASFLAQPLGFSESGVVVVAMEHALRAVLAHP